MRPVPVPEHIRSAPWVEGTAVFSAPNGDLTSEQIPPAEGIFYRSHMDGFDGDPMPMVGVILRFDDDEMDAIRSGASHLLLSWPGRRMPVFVVPQVLDVGDDS